MVFSGDKCDICPGHSLYKNAVTWIHVEVHSFVPALPYNTRRCKKWFSMETSETYAQAIVCTKILWRKYTLKFIDLSPLYPIILDDVVANLAPAVVVRLRPRQGHRSARKRHQDCSSRWHWAVWWREKTIVTLGKLTGRKIKGRKSVHHIIDYLYSQIIRTFLQPLDLENNELKYICLLTYNLYNDSFMSLRLQRQMAGRQISNDCIWFGRKRLYSD
jgi:hypothetical protein